MAAAIAATPSISEPATSAAELDSTSPIPSPNSSTAGSEDDSVRPTSSRLSRPKLGSRKSSGTMIVARDSATEVEEEELEEGDVRTMSPRRNSEEVDRLGEAARKDLVEQAKLLQTSLQAIVDRVETVKSEHEKLEGGNKFLQSYIGELMQTSKITSTAPLKSKGKGRSTK